MSRLIHENLLERRIKMKNIDEIKLFGVKCGIITIEDIEKYTVMELIFMMIKKINELVNSVNGINSALAETIINQLNKWLEDGTLAGIINKTIFNDISNQLKVLKDNLYLSTWYEPKPDTIKSTMLGDETIPSEYSFENYEKFYDWILNPLVRDFPELVSKRALGKEQSDNFMIYRYDIKSETADRTLIITSCLHGNEYTSFYGLCRFLDELIRRPETSPVLMHMLKTTHFVIIPIANPWGFVNENRRNSRGVDLNRNADYRWEEYTAASGQIGQPYYKGSAPFSEKETLYLRSVADEVCTAERVVGYIDLHTINTILAEKILYYPRFAKNNFTGMKRTLELFNPQTGYERTIFSSSAVPTMTNWMVHAKKVYGCNPEWNNSAYGGNRTNQLMNRHVCYIANLFYSFITENKSQRQNNNGTKIYHLKMDKKQFTNEVEDENRNSIKGHRILNSTTGTLNAIPKSDFYLDKIDRECIIMVNGYVKVEAEKECNVTVDPLLYQQHAPEMTYSTMLNKNLFTENIHLQQGDTVYIPIVATIQAYHSNYNDESSKRPELVNFRIRALTDMTNSAYITAFRINILQIPTDLGLCVETKEYSGTDDYTVIYPLRLDEELDD